MSDQDKEEMEKDKPSEYEEDTRGKANLALVLALLGLASAIIMPFVMARDDYKQRLETTRLERRVEENQKTLNLQIKRLEVLERKLKPHEPKKQQASLYAPR